MRVWLPLLFCIASTQNVAAVEDPNLPTAMKRALDRLAKGDVGPSTLKPHQFLRGLKPSELQPDTASPKTCSVPLVGMPVDHPERFMMLQVTPKQQTATMPHVDLPAPPCDLRNP